MTASKRVAATSRVTAAVQSWLWHRRRCRVLCLEVDMTGSLSRPVSGPGDARVDVLGLAEMRGGRSRRS